MLRDIFSSDELRGSTLALVGRNKATLAKTAALAELLNEKSCAGHIIEQTTDRRAARLIHHPGYSCGALPENLNSYDRDMKCAVYAVTLAGVMSFDHPASWQHYDQSFVGRNYCRVASK